MELSTLSADRGAAPQLSPVASLSRQLLLQANAPRTVRLELILTEACNLGCTYCFEYNADHQNNMSLETATAAVDYLLEASRTSPWIGITFMGGEPMLRFELIEKIISYAKRQASTAKKRVTFGMQTNGVLIKPAHAKYFRDVGLRYCLSLDGVRGTNDKYRQTLGGSGTFQIVAAKIRMLKAYQPWQGARMTIMPECAPDLDSNIRALHEEFSINQFIIGPATHVDWSDSQVAHYSSSLKRAFDFFAEERVQNKSRRLRIGLFEIGQLSQGYVAGRAEAWGCGAGSGRLAVAPDGSFHGCSKLAWGVTGGSKAAPLPLGSVDTGMSQPENRLKLLDHTVAPRLKCHACEIATHCSGGCHAANIADTGDMYIPADYFCKLMFAQKDACEYARSRIRDLGLPDLYWNSTVPDLGDLSDQI